MLTLDHIAICTTALERGVQETQATLGLELAPGGQHPAMGTHNRLLSLGPSEYLEVIAIDPDAPAPDQPRWFDLDRFDGATRSTTWICRTPDIAAAIARCPAGIGPAWALSRGDLNWQITIPETGVLPFDGLFPALIEWDGPAHPAPRLPDLGVRLDRLTLVHPEADALRAALAPLVSDPRMEVRSGETPAMSAHMTTPGGQVTL